MAVVIKVVVDRSFIKLLAFKALGYFCGGEGVCNGYWGARDRELEIFFCEILCKFLCTPLCLSIFQLRIISL